MPAKSKAQQEAAALALSAKLGKIPASKLKGAAKEMFKSLSIFELRKFASTRRAGLPDVIRSGGMKIRR